MNSALHILEDGVKYYCTPNFTFFNTALFISRYVSPYFIHGELYFTKWKSELNLCSIVLQPI